jgi:hypothetical protein
VISASVGAERPRGASVRWRAERTLRSICDRREEYIDRVWTERCLITKKTATIPMSAAAGPTIR